MKFLIIISMLTIFFTSCKSSQQSTKQPIEDKPVIVHPIKMETNDLKKEISKLAIESKCAAYLWKNRGKAPIGYIKGMAVMYARQVCGHGSDFIKSETIKGRNSIQAYKDALSFYGIKGSELNTYTFLIGLGMRESSGKYCTGRDRSASFDSSQDAEAGLFQMAYIARVFNSNLDPIYTDYKGRKKECELDIFKEGVSCSKYDAENFGSGEGSKWQSLMKVCPAMASEWAAILIRSNYRHFGPIIRREVEFNNDCRNMFIEVEALAKGNCDKL